MISHCVLLLYIYYLYVLHIKYMCINTVATLSIISFVFAEQCVILFKTAITRIIRYCILCFTVAQ